MTYNKKALIPVTNTNESIKFKIFNNNIISKTLENENIFVLYDENKIPYSAYTKQKTSIINKNNLCNYKYALNVLQNTTKFKGIGIVLGNTTKGNLACLDIDNCIDNKGNISDIAKELINLLNTYTEISKSGKGIHCLFFANKPYNLCKNNKLQGCKALEMYDNKRYIALTDNCINSINIEYRQEQCNVISDKYFKNEKQALKTNFKADRISFKPIENDKLQEYIELIKNTSLKDKKLCNYWYGKIECNDESSNDLGLFQKLAHYTNMKELALSSPFFARKDNKHKDKWLKRKDYLQRTILKALANYKEYKNE